MKNFVSLYRKHLPSGGGISNKTSLSLWVVFRNDEKSFSYYMENLGIKSEPLEERVPDTARFSVDIDRNHLVGTVNIRHY